MNLKEAYDHAVEHLANITAQVEKAEADGIDAPWVGRASELAAEQQETVDRLTRIKDWTIVDALGNLNDLIEEADEAYFEDLSAIHNEDYETYVGRPVMDDIMSKMNAKGPIEFVSVRSHEFGKVEDVDLTDEDSQSMYMSHPDHEDVEGIAFKESADAAMYKLRYT